MSTILTPPPAPPTAPYAASDPQPGGPVRSSSRAVAVVASVVGGVIVLGALTVGTIQVLANSNRHSETYRVAVDGVTDLDLDFSSGEMTIAFGNVDEAVLDVRDSSSIGEWTLRVDGDELIAESPRGGFGFGWFNRSGDVTLTLPKELEGMNADLDIGAGSLEVDGAFRAVAVDLGAGDVEVRGTATEVTAYISAGDAEIDLKGVKTAELSVSAGRLVAFFGGDAPQSIDASVSAGDLELTVPDGRYDVTSTVSAGDFENSLGSDPGAANRIHVEVSAGNATLDGGARR